MLVKQGFDIDLQVKLVHCVQNFFPGVPKVKPLSLEAHKLGNRKIFHELFSEMQNKNKIRDIKL